MITYIEELENWIDEENLVGSSRFPKKWSTGNAILETSTAIVIDFLLQEKLGELKKRKEVLEKLLNGIKSCQKESGIFDKNPNRKDEITHDDLIGAAAASDLLDRKIVKNLVKFGEENYWILSNTGKPYFTAYAKIWHKIFYEICAGKKVSLFEKIILALSLLLPSSSSGDRLDFIQLAVLQNKSYVFQLAKFFWKIKIRKKYGSISKMLENYYNNKEHIFVIYTKDLDF